MSEFFPGLRSLENPVVFFEVSVDDSKIGTLQFELFHDSFPKLFTGEFRSSDQPIGYKNGQVFQIFPEQYLIADLVDRSLIADLSESYFAENFFESASEMQGVGSIGLSSEGKKSEFYVTFAPCEWMNEVGPCIGRMYNLTEDGLKVLKAIEKIPTGLGGRPLQKVWISQCGLM